MGGERPALTVNNLAEEIRQVAEPIARALGLEVIEVQCFGKLSNPLARVVLDKEGGIGIQGSLESRPKKSGLTPTSLGATVALSTCKGKPSALPPG